MKHATAVLFCALFYAPFCALFCMECVGCGSASETKAQGDSAAPAISATPSRTRQTPNEVTRKEQPTLADDEVRVPLFVLPGDAMVEVDDAVVRRRNGTVELVGKIGAERRVRVFSGTTRTEEMIVKIESTGASPASIDARAPSAFR